MLQSCPVISFIESIVVTGIFRAHQVSAPRCRCPLSKAYAIIALER